MGWFWLTAKSYIFFSPSLTVDKVTPEIRDIRIIVHVFADGQGEEEDADNSALK